MDLINNLSLGFSVGLVVGAINDIVEEAVVAGRAEPGAVTAVAPAASAGDTPLSPDATVELLTRVREGDRAALDRLLARHEARPGLDLEPVVAAALTVAKDWSNTVGGAFRLEVTKDASTTVSGRPSARIVMARSLVRALSPRVWSTVASTTWSTERPAAMSSSWVPRSMMRPAR